MAAERAMAVPDCSAARASQVALLWGYIYKPLSTWQISLTAQGLSALQLIQQKQERKHRFPAGLWCALDTRSSCFSAASAWTAWLGLHPLGEGLLLSQVPQEQSSRCEQPSMSCFHPPLWCSRYLWHDSESNCVSQPSREHMQISFRPLQKRCIIPLVLVEIFHSVVFGCLVIELSLYFKNGFDYGLLGCAAKERFCLSTDTLVLVSVVPAN